MPCFHCSRVWAKATSPSSAASSLMVTYLLVLLLWYWRTPLKSLRLSEILASLLPTLGCSAATLCDPWARRARKKQKQIPVLTNRVAPNRNHPRKRLWTSQPAQATPFTSTLPPRCLTGHEKISKAHKEEIQWPRFTFVALLWCLSVVVDQGTPHASRCCRGFANDHFLSQASWLILCFVSDSQKQHEQHQWLI